MNVLVVAAHPDDEVLGAGGTIAVHAEAGDMVTIAILGEGATSRTDSSKSGPNAVAQLKADASKAADILGAVNVQFMDLPDNRFDNLELLNIVKRVEQVVSQYQPDIVYTHCEHDLNIDHVITHRAVLTACRPLPGSRVRRVLTFEVPSSTGWAGPHHNFIPNVFMDISRTLGKKTDAMQAYDTEIRAFPHPRSIQALIYRAGVWGSQVGLEAVEAFSLVREVIH